MSWLCSWIFDIIDATNEKKHKSKPTKVIDTKKKSIIAIVWLIAPTSSLCKSRERESPGWESPGWENPGESPGKSPGWKS